MKKKGILIATVLAVFYAFLGCSSDDRSPNDGTDQMLRVEKLTCYERSDFTVEPVVGREPPAPGSESVATYASFCSPSVCAGTDTPLLAILQSAGGLEEVVAAPAVWSVDDPKLASVSENGVLTALGPGDITVTVCADGLCSDPYPVTIIEDPEVVAIEIFPNIYYPLPVMDAIGGAEGWADSACFDCPFWMTYRMLKGDTVQFFAQGILETGGFVDLTREVTWLSSQPEVAAIDAEGLLTALAAGTTEVTAEYEGLTSNEVEVEVLEEAVLTGLNIERQSFSGIIKVGGIEQLHAVAYYDPWAVRDVTSEADWILSDPALGTVSEEGIFTALAPGMITIRASFSGALSDEIQIEIWDEVEMEFCDPQNPNRSVWEDEYNRVILESDCASYTRPDSVAIRYTIEEKLVPPWGILDPCLDLVILPEGSSEIVRTLRFEGCGDLPFDVAVQSAEALEPIYQYLTTWDLKDDDGAEVPPGSYVVAGRFFIYYDPVIHLGITVE